MEERKMKTAVRNPLGRGLSALISSPVANYPGIKETHNTAHAVFPEISISEQKVASLLTIPINQITKNHHQPRHQFPQVELTELAESIRTNGIIQPIIVRPISSDGQAKYELVAGERRWRAAQMAGLSEVPAIIQHCQDKQALEIALVENIQRSNLNPIEEALAYKRLTDEFSLTQKEIAERMGKDRASIANYLRLLTLPDQVIELLKESKISMGHAKAILTVREPSAQISLAKKCVNESLSVRQIEEIVGRVVVLDAGTRTPLDKSPVKSTISGHDLSALPEVQERLRRSLGTKVTLRHSKSGRGQIEIHYYSEQELDRLVEHICR